MEILNNIKDDESIEAVYDSSKKCFFKNTVFANIIYILMWIAFDAFFIYVLTIEAVIKQYWFICIPAAGFNLIVLWTFVFKYLKVASDLKTSGYVVTDKAFYYYNDGNYKELKRIAFNDIVALEKSEYFGDGFYVATLTSTIHVLNIKEEMQLFNYITEKIR